MQSSPATFRSISEGRYWSHSFTPGGYAGIFCNQINNPSDNKDLAELYFYGILSQPADKSRSYLLR